MRHTPRAVPWAAALAAAAALAVAASPAAAAPCPGGLTVAGKPVTGDDCVAQPDGGVEILNPRFGASGAVRLVGAAGGPGRMLLNAARTQMTMLDQLRVMRLEVNGKALIMGGVTVGNHEFCDLAEPRSQAFIQGFQQTDPELGDFTGEPLLPQSAGCRTLPSFRFDFGLFDKLGKILGLDLGGNRAFADMNTGQVGVVFGNEANPNGLSFRIPRTFAFDDERGGRVFGVVDLNLPRPFTFKQTGNTSVTGGADTNDVAVRVGIGIELSAAEGIRPISLAVDIPKDIPLLVPGVKVRDLLAIIDPTNNRFGGGARVVLPGNKAFGGEAIVRNAALEKLGFDIGFPSPGVPLFSGIFLNAIGGTFTAAQTVPGLAGAVSTTPFSIQGRFLANVGPNIAGKGPLSLTTTATVAGPTIKLTGEARALANALKLAQAKVLIGANPFRFEADSSVNALGFLTGRIFVGLTAQAFTGLGEVAIKIPNKVKFVGGQTLGGFQAAVSNVGAGGLITIDPPLVKPFSLGVGTKWSPVNIDVISALTPFITVRPSAAAVAAAAASGRPVALAAGQRRLRLPGGDVIVSVTGSRRLPRGVRILGANGRPLRTVVVGRNNRTLELGLVAPRGAVQVTSRDAIRALSASRIGTFPYLDPSPGAGTRPRPPVTAGTPVRVCWRTKGTVPRGTVVDIFEDQNGSLGTGRLLASGRRANGCFDVPTDGLEPGRHWVYGVVRVGDRLIGTRYWPIPITITDPKALPAPTAQIVATADGASVRITPVPNAQSYVVRAEPSDEHAGEPVTQDVAATDPTAELSLRGARRWVVTVAAVGPDARPGNPSAPVTVQPTDPVVLAGKPNGVAEVGRRWAFQLDTAPGTRVRLLKGPRGMRIAGGAALLQWTPSAAAGRRAPQEFSVQACRGDRCVTRSFTLSAYGRNIAPFGPARGFTVTPNVLPRSGGTITIRAQGIDERAVVKIDGRVRRARRIDAQTLEVVTGRLARGKHDVSLKIGGDLEERRPGAVVVL